MRSCLSYVVTAALLSASPAWADQVSGVVVKIVGQRVTLQDAGGKTITLSIPEASTLKAGDKITVTYAPVGDALRASQVVHQPN